MARANPEEEVLKRYSPRLARWFTRWLRGYFRRNFDGVRMARAGAPPEETSGPLIVYTNHPSWWDPIHFLLLAGTVIPGRRMFGPFDADIARRAILRELKRGGQLFYVHNRVNSIQTVAARLANFASIVRNYSLSDKKMLTWINLWKHP